MVPSIRRSLSLFTSPVKMVPELMRVALLAKPLSDWFFSLLNIGLVYKNDKIQINRWIPPLLVLVIWLYPDEPLHYHLAPFLNHQYTGPGNSPVFQVNRSGIS